MNIVNLCCYAEGYYSGAKYEENVVISEDFYEKIKNLIETEECVSLGELDGKHSNVEGNIDVQFFNEKEIDNAGFDKDNSDGSCLYEYLKETIGDSLSKELDDNIKEIKDYLSTRDLYEDMTISVRRSNKQKVLDFLKTLEP